MPSASQSIPSLAHLDDVKVWLGLAGNANADELLKRLITAASGFVLGYIQRASVEWQEFAEYYDGHWNDFLVLRQFPATDVVSILFQTGQVISTPSPPGTFDVGYILEPPSSTQQRLKLVGCRFPEGRSNIFVTYHAGYLIDGEVQIIPSDGLAPLSILPMRPWLADQGVTFVVGGAALTAVPAGTAPAAGQYAIDPATTVYTFNAADGGKAVSLKYSYCPEDIEQATIELVGERYKTMSRIGLQSETRNAAGALMTTSFSQKDMNETINGYLRPYRKVAIG